MTIMRGDNDTPGGFTLIEILVSLAISGMVLTGIFHVFNTSNRSYIVQEDIARMQQNVRIAKYFIEKDLRMAGYGVRNLAVDGSKVDAVVFENNLQNDPDTLDNTDTLRMIYMDDQAADCGTNPGSNRSCEELPQLLLKAEMPPTSAEAEVHEELGDDPYSYWDDGCSCNGTDYDSPQFGFQVIITSPDGSQSDLLWVTGVQNTGGDDKIQNHQYTDDDGIKHDNKVLNKYPENSTIKFFNSDAISEVKYFIDKDHYLRHEKNGIATKLAENIEDMQVAFGGDFNDDGDIDLTDDDDWFDEADLVSGEMTDSDKDKIRYVRVTLLGRTAREHDGVSSIRPSIEDHVGATQSDGYRRRILSFTVKIRNLGLDD
jgi:type IV pilus assembly protein PilW